MLERITSKVKGLDDLNGYFLQMSAFYNSISANFGNHTITNLIQIPQQVLRCIMMVIRKIRRRQRFLVVQQLHGSFTRWMTYLVQLRLIHPSYRFTLDKV